ncbi:uncharacterized protein MELLADRAFT_61056 [Melampsora larici-populina 98AG31]|uniref:Glutaredoxin-like protein n=1 Tax=Melampsora larici-populina (strain 98AG31 / pathotype 3-4-7) TaxID=747676 RepID=F4RDF2_MELLP|nr:uncharacterized protein MELLADRAFT_61056 [Melampsora larici-populina 98AG31]EGG09620.1 hypothetical protein MELLADRAFT_61056 [Melampsora larici-populina 98AG31]
MSLGSTKAILINNLRPNLTLFTAPHCTLCNVFRTELLKLKDSSTYPYNQFQLSYYNIRDSSLEDHKLYRRAYQYDIPVLHLDGKELMRHRLDIKLLTQRLREWHQLAAKDTLGQSLYDSE